jgi:hypothetical protein
MDTTVPHASAAPGLAPTVQRSDADRTVRRLLFLEPDAPKVSLFGAQSAFQKSIAISAVRCLITYIFLPLLRPVVDLSGGVGPTLGLIVGAVSMVAIYFAVRRFFAADHKWRWGYGAVGGGIFLLLTVQAVVDVRALLG